MKALSIQQPWSYAILYLGKNIENRTWNTNFRGEFYIHSPQKFDLQAYELLENFYDLPTISDLKRGGITGKVELVDVLKPEDNNLIWSDKGKYGLVLSNPIPIEFIPCKGKLNFFEINL